jgi:hypothetical protein
MGNAVSQGLTATQWYVYGKRHFTATGWERASKLYKSQLDAADLSGKIYMVTGANSGIGREVVSHSPPRWRRLPSNSPTPISHRERWAFPGGDHSGQGGDALHGMPRPHTVRWRLLWP